MVEVDSYDYSMANEIEGAQEERNEVDILRVTIKKVTASIIMKGALSLMDVKAGVTRRPIRIPNGVIVEDIRGMLRGYNFL